jgi:predicted nucleotidyltransferase
MADVDQPSEDIERLRAFERLLAEAREDEAIVGLFVFGSRGRGVGVDERSDYDVGVVLRDESALAAFDQRWPLPARRRYRGREQHNRRTARTRLVRDGQRVGSLPVRTR